MAFNSIEDYIRNLEFKKIAFGGVDQEDVLYKMRELISLFQREAEQIRLKGGSSVSDIDLMKAYEEKLANAEKELAEARARIAQSDKRLKEAASWIHEASGKMAKYQTKLAEYEAGMADSAEKLSAYAGRLAESENRLFESEARLAEAERRLADAEEKLAGAGTTGEAFGGMDMAEFEKRWNEELDAIREECDRRIAKIEEDYNEKLERANASRTVKIAAETVKVNVMPREKADLS